MSDFSNFPTTRSEALALIYCEKHATSETTPEELAEMYSKAYKAIREAIKNSRQTGVSIGSL